MNKPQKVTLVSFIITEKCNLNCSYCWYTRGILERRPKRELPLEHMIEFLSALALRTDVSQIELTGGEALLHSDIGLMIPALSKYSKRLIVMTNALLLNDKLIDLLERHSVVLHISLDSFITDYHDQQRGKQKETIEKILLLTRKGYIHKQINTTLSRKNIEDIPHLLHFASANQCEIDFRLIDFDENEDLSLFHAEENEITMLFNVLNGWTQGNRRKELKVRLYKRLLLDKKFKAPSCLLSRHQLVVDVNGDIRPCYNHNEAFFGNIMNFNEVEDVLMNHRNFNQVMNKPISCYENNCIHLITG